MDLKRVGLLWLLSLVLLCVWLLSSTNRPLFFELTPFQHFLASIQKDGRVVATCAHGKGLANEKDQVTIAYLIKSAQRLKMSNFFLACYDEDSVTLAQRLGSAYFRFPLPEHKSSNAWFPIAKAALARDITLLGYSVLLLHADVLLFEDPWQYIVGDKDFEIATEGFGYGNDNPYGHWHAAHEEGWPPVHALTMPQLNIGVMYARATPCTSMALKVLVQWISRQPIWDQGAFSEYLLMPAVSISNHVGLPHHSCSLRILDIYKFPTSCQIKHLFKRNHPALRAPALIHFNCNHPRRKAVMKTWHNFLNGTRDWVGQGVIDVPDQYRHVSKFTFP